MRTIERSSAFQRDYMRTKATPRYRKELGSLLSDVVSLLLTDDVLPAIFGITHWPAIGQSIANAI